MFKWEVGYPRLPYFSSPALNLRVQLSHNYAMQASTSARKTSTRIDSSGSSEAQSIPASGDWVRSSQTMSSSQILGPVREDMEQMAENLRNIVGNRHPLLLAAAEQIFGAGGKKLRPAIVFLVARATADLMGLRSVLLFIMLIHGPDYFNSTLDDS